MNTQYPILIVEDSTVERRILEKKLKNCGYNVVAASNGEEALKILKKNFFPIIITDWMMPKVDGVELCTRIRKKNLPSYTFIILLTSKTQKNDIIMGLDAGADDYLTKPVNVQELTARLRSGMRILELEKKLSGALKKIKIMAITDELTGSYNRRYLIKSLNKEIGRCKRYKRHFSIAMFDIDHFKKINDIYGHHIGDNALREIARTIETVIRSDLDWLARYGGEEFVMVFPETDLNGAQKVIERIQGTLASLTIPQAPKDLKITVSFGITAYNPLENNNKNLFAQDIIKAADQYLYRAKKEGRDRAVVGPLK
ncbi:MAG: diguanylate cyclase [bacterium]